MDGKATKTQKQQLANGHLDGSAASVAKKLLQDDEKMKRSQAEDLTANPFSIVKRLLAAALRS